MYNYFSNKWGDLMKKLGETAQAKNIQEARKSYKEKVLERINNSGFCAADKDTMTRIIIADTDSVALWLYEDADTAIREYIQNIITTVIEQSTSQKAGEVSQKSLVCKNTMAYTYKGALQKAMEKGYQYIDGRNIEDEFHDLDATSDDTPKWQFLGNFLFNLDDIGDSDAEMYFLDY